MKDIYFLNNLISKEESLSMTIDLLMNSIQTENVFTLSKILRDSKKPNIKLGNSIELGEINPPNRLAQFWKKTTPLIKETIGNPNIIGSSAWCRVYQNGSKLERHIDRENLDWSITVPIYCNLKNDWPFYIEKEDKEIVTVGNDIGSAVLFRSNKLYHWRDELNCGKDEFSIHLFLHWRIL